MFEASFRLGKKISADSGDSCSIKPRESRHPQRAVQNTFHQRDRYTLTPALEERTAAREKEDPGGDEV